MPIIRPGARTASEPPSPCDPRPGGEALSSLRANTGRYLRLAREPAWLGMFSLGRIDGVRRMLRAGPEPVDGTISSDAVEGDAAAVVAALEHSGLGRPLRLRPEPLAALRRHAEAGSCLRGDDVPAGPERALHRGRPIVRIDPRGCAALEELAGDPLLGEIARAYLGPGAHLLGTRMWWTFPVDRCLSAAERVEAATDRFHFDLDDWQTVKFLFYLGDVDDAGGPHRYVLGSHRRHPLISQVPAHKGLTPSRVVRTYGRDAITTVTGSAGTGFAIDPYGFHTGSRVHGRGRPVAEVQFARSALGDPERLRRAYHRRRGLDGRPPGGG